MGIDTAVLNVLHLFPCCMVIPSLQNFPKTRALVIDSGIGGANLVVPIFIQSMTRLHVHHSAMLSMSWFR